MEDWRGFAFQNGGGVSQSHATDLEWQRAFALQALSDLDARELLVNRADLCQELHFLQMATEKVCKAYLIQEEGYRQFKPRHDVIAKTLPAVAKQFLGLRRESLPKKGQRANIQKIAIEIERLSPNCHENKTRPDNCEYPWEDSTGKVQTPCKEHFDGLDVSGRTVFQVIRLLRVAAMSFSQ